MWEDDRIEAVLRKYRDRPVEEIIKEVVTAVDEYAVGMDQFDDMTLIAVRILDK